MGRIRSIKPEFPQSESMGRISRDARLCFIEIWTLADDAGRLRGSSRMLASLLFPYDDDAPGLIDVWLGELEREECIVRYMHEGQSYIEVTNWRLHQKIEKPTQSRIPTPPRGLPEGSPTPPRGLPEGSPTPPRGLPEGSPEDWIGSRRGEERKGEDKKTTHITREEKTSDQIDNEWPEADPVFPAPGEENYPRAVFAAWAELGDKVYQPPNFVAFANSSWGKISRAVQGIHSDQVLAAIANFGLIITAPPGTYFWNQRVTVDAFVEKHLAKFLPSNFDPKSFEVRAPPPKTERWDGKGMRPEVREFLNEQKAKEAAHAGT